VRGRHVAFHHKLGVIPLPLDRVGLVDLVVSMSRPAKELGLVVERPDGQVLLVVLVTVRQSASLVLLEVVTV
jgi:hypothetical protein